MLSVYVGGSKAENEGVEVGAVWSCVAHLTLNLILAIQIRFFLSKQAF